MEITSKMILDVGCGYLPDHKRYANTEDSVGVDLRRGEADLLCDVAYLPFKKEAFEHVYCRNMLEHLEQPMKSLKELQRVMKFNADISITIPIHHNAVMDEFIKYLLGFPLRFPITLIRIQRWRRNSTIPGFRHLNRIRVNHIKKIFKIIRISEEFSEHPIHYWLYGRKGRMVRRIIGKMILRLPLPDILNITAKNTLTYEGR